MSTAIAPLPPVHRSARGGTAVCYYEIAGERFPLKAVSGCKTCSNQELRVQVDYGILCGHSYKTIAESLPPDSGLNARNIRNHFNNGHLPLALHVRRKLMESHAEALGRNIDEHMLPLGDGIAFARLGVQSVIERMNCGEIAPTIGEGISLARFLYEVEQTGGVDADAHAMSEAMTRMMELARMKITPDNYGEWARSLAEDKILRAILEKLPRPDAIEAHASDREEPPALVASGGEIKVCVADSAEAYGSATATVIRL